MIRKILMFEGTVVHVEDDREVRVNNQVVLAVDPAEAHHSLDGAIEFHRQFEEFVKAVRGRPNRSVTGAEGVRLMRVLDAVRRSAVNAMPEVPR